MAQQEIAVSDEAVNNIFSDNPIPAPIQTEFIEDAIVLTDKGNDEPIVTQPGKVIEKLPEFDEANYIKEKWGFDSPDVAKETIQKWRTAEAQPKAETKPEPIKFANPESEKLFNLIQEGNVKEAMRIYQKQEEIEAAEKMPAIEAIKLDLKNKKQHYSNEDIQDIVDEKYAIPTKPVQGNEELDSEFQERMNAYDMSVAKVNRRIERDGKEAVSELQKQKIDLILPDINGSVAKNQELLHQQEELQKQNALAKANYLTALDKDYSNFTGFKTVYKDKDVEIPIEYKPTEQELKDLKNTFTNGFDADDFFASRWIKTDGDKVVGHNIAQQMEDYYLLTNKQKVFDKISSDAHAKALDEFMKGEKRMKFNEGYSDRIAQPSVNQKVEEQLTGNLWGK